MEIKDQNSNKSWQERLDAYTIPEAASAREASWEKLRARLDLAPERKNKSWYWVAAAAVVFFVLILCCMPVSTRTNEPAFTKTPALLKQDHNINVPADSIQAAINSTVKTVIPVAKKALNNIVDTIALAHVKNKSVVPLPVDPILKQPVNETPVADDMVQQPARLQSVHINDVLNADPTPERITTKSLAVKKMIRLFSVDFTKQQPPKKQDQTPASPYTIPNNQN